MDGTRTDGTVVVVLATPEQPQPVQPTPDIKGPEPAPVDPAAAATPGATPDAAVVAAAAQPILPSQAQRAAAPHVADPAIGKAGPAGRRTTAPGAQQIDARAAANGRAEGEATGGESAPADASVVPAVAAGAGASSTTTGPSDVSDANKAQPDLAWTQTAAGVPGAATRDPGLQPSSPGTPAEAAPVSPAGAASAAHPAHALASESNRDAAKRADAAEAAPAGETFHAMVFDAATLGSGGRVAHHGAASDIAQPTPDGRSAQQAPAVPVSAVPIEIGMRALAGAQSFQIRLHPEEYGRIDVKLNIDDDGSVSAQISVDRVEALTMLQRDAKTLERAFEQAGLKTNENSLQFSLNNGGGDAARDQANREQQQQQRRPPGAAASESKAIPADVAAALRSIRTGATGLDIHI